MLKLSLIALTCIFLAITFFAWIRKPLNRPARPEGAGVLVMMTILMFTVVEIFVVSLIGWGVALVILLCVTTGFLLMIFLTLEVVTSFIDLLNLPVDLMAFFSSVILITSPVTAVLMSLYLLSRAAQLPGTGWFDGLVWISQICTPGLMPIALIFLGVSITYRKITSGEKAKQI